MIHNLIAYVLINWHWLEILITIIGLFAGVLLLFEDDGWLL